MSSLSTGASVTINLPSGQSLRLLYTGGYGLAVMGPGPRRGSTYPLSGGEVLGPFEGPQAIYLSCSSGSLSYDIGVRLAEPPGFIGTYTFATLPDPTKYPNGTQAYTTDQGLVALQNGVWAVPGGASFVWGSGVGNLPDQADLWAALGGTTFGGASDETIDDYDDTTGVVNVVVIDGLTWTLAWHTDGRLDTATCGALVRQYVYDGQNRYIGINGVKIQGGALQLTFAQMIALVPTVPGLKVRLTDTYPGTLYTWSGTMWQAPASRFRFAGSGVQRILLGGSGATYSQTGTTVTVTLTGHLLTAAADNGSSVYLTQSTGALVSGWFTNLTYVDANSFTCTSTVSQSTSGNLGTQTGEITVDTLTLKGKMLGPNGELNGWFFTTASANNANAKTLRLKFGGSTVLNPSIASTLSAHTPFRLQNRGNTAKQIGFSTSSTSQNGSTTAAPNPYTIDTEADVTVLITMQLATATDHMKLCGYVLDVLQG